MAKGKQHPRLDKISKLPAQFYPIFNFPLNSIGHVLQLIKALGAQSPSEIVGNFMELQPRISSCDSAPTPAILLHSFDSKGVKTQLENDWTMMTVKSKHSVSERPSAWQLGL